MAPHASPPSPERIFSTLTAYRTCAALVAAIRIELFSHVLAGADTLPALAKATGASERGLRALANHLVAHEFLTKEGERYRCAPDAAAFLDARAASYMGSVVTFLNDPGLVGCFEDLTAAVERGGTVVPGGGTVATENPLWVEFARGMQPMARAFAGGVADVLCAQKMPRRVLDIAAGHGLYGIEIALRSPMTELISQDWASVLVVARENAERAGLGERVLELAGSAFEVEFPASVDLVLVTNFLHHFERELCVGFLAKCRGALAPGGRVAVLEFVLEDDRVTPPSAAAFDLVMLATTPHGEAYTATEFAEMFVEAGLTAPERHDLAGDSHALFVAGAAP